MGTVPQSQKACKQERDRMAKAASVNPREKTCVEGIDKLQNGQVWRAIFRPGSIFRRGYADSPRNRAYVVMNSLLYHLHPVKVKRHGIKLSYTLCLGGLSFFLFILLTITGIYLMFFYRPSVEMVYADMQRLHTQVSFGLLVRNLHRWGAHLMVITVFLHMARVFYTGAYKPPREFNWIVGVVLLAADPAAGIHRLPASVGPARGVGRHGRYRDDEELAGDRRSGAVRLTWEDRSSGRRRCCGGTRSMCCSCRSSS